MGGLRRKNALLAFLIFFCLSAMAEPVRHVFHTDKPEEMLEEMGVVAPGDTMVIDGKPFLVEAKVGGGSWGMVFRVEVDGRTEALKIWHRADALDQRHGPFSLAGQAKALKDWKGSVSVPEVYEAPAHGMYLRMEYIDGLNFSRRLSLSMDAKSRIQELRAVDELWAELEKSNTHPQISNLHANVVYSDSRKKYFLVDPDVVTKGGIFDVWNVKNFSEEAALVRFERQVKEGKFPESKQALSGRGEAFMADGKFNPEWVAQYILYADLPQFSDDLSDKTDWTRLSTDRRDKLSHTLTEALRENFRRLPPGPHLPTISPTASIVGTLLRNPLVKDAEVAEAYLQKLLPHSLRETWARLPTEIRGKLKEREWLQKFLGADYSQYPSWIRSAFVGRRGMSYLAAEDLLRKITHAGLERSPVELLQKLAQNDFEFFKQLDSNQLYALVGLVEEKLPSLSLADRLSLLETEAELVGQASARELSWPRFFPERRSLLVDVLWDPKAPLPERLRALRLPNGLTNTHFEAVASSAGFPAPLRIAALEALTARPDVGEEVVTAVNAALANGNLATQKAARAARDKLVAEGSSAIFSADTWKLRFLDVCARVRDAASKLVRP